MAVSHVTDRDFKEQVLEQEIPVVVTFRADWCEPSQQLAPMMDELATAYEGRVRVVSFNLGGQEPKACKVCKRYGVNRLPVVMLFREGRIKDLIGGFPSKEDISDAINRQLQPVLDVGEHNFQQEVLDSKVPVLVHFHSATCEQSLALMSTVESVAQEFRGRAKVVRVAADPFNASLLARYSAIRFPMLAAFQDGEMKDRILGAVREQAGGERAAVGSGVQNVTDMLEQLVM